MKLIKHPVWLLGMAAAGLPWQHALAQQQSNVSNVQRQAQQLDATRGQGEAKVTQGEGTRAARSVQQELKLRAEQTRRDLAETRRREQQALLPPPPIGGASPSSSESSVDERPLWDLLKRRDLAGFDRQLARARAAHPAWTAPASLPAERARLQKEGEIERLFAYARTGPVGPLSASQLQALVAAHPQDFSCARIDRLWGAAEIFARAGRKDAAFALYRSVFPDCSPAANRIATLYMAQQALGADSEMLAQLLAAEAGGRRDDESEAKFQRLLYDRQLTRVAALDPAGADALMLVPVLSDAIRGYLDAPAATLAGWIMLAHNDLAEGAVWFNRARQWQPGNVDAQLGLLQIRLQAGDIAGADRLLAEPALAADPRAKAQRARLQLLRADRYNQNKDYAASLAALDEAERLGASKRQTASLRGWNLYGGERYEAAAQIFSSEYRAARDPRMAEGWALAENARGRLALLAATPEARQAPLSVYVSALQSQQLYYRKQFVEADSLRQRTEDDIAAQPEADAMQLREGVQAYLPDNLQGVRAASVTAGVSYSNHAGADGQGHLETTAPALRAQWFGGADGARQYDLRLRGLRLDAGQASPDGVARALGVPAAATQSGFVNVRELWFGAQDSVWLTDAGRLAWQAAAGVTDGGAGGTELHGQAAIGQQAQWGNWSVYAGSNPVRDSLLSWRGMALPGTGQWWGDVRRNALGARTLAQLAPRWSAAANAELAAFGGHNVQGNSALALDLGLGYDLRLAGFDYFNLGPALHYLRYDNNQNQYGWGLGGYYSPQRSVSAGIASQFMTPEGRQSQLSGNLELGWNSAAESAASCLPVPFRSVAASAVNCGYAGSSDSGIYAHVQLAAVRQLAPRWQLGVLGDLNLTPGRDRQYAAMLFVRYFFEDRAAVFSRDLPKTTRDFAGQLDDGR
ncbi:cellulose synthase subunit BcsC-related outer membrane protein [Herbaspirillum sp. WKF16]|uniref:cellulose synthase subunit BcsC-related outer membrane protein n=1 Tax=Herbaspirillum sp. WKF16 TaxID=3028312 RepID=UPI0023A9AE0C|nr:cellulose synthase subunit BcsC-related outer membrane protein [Herbaspirillum sp. WKF16]WDZ97210.1 cellulose synthase subunit BcsC-related outer membrane protein [Herbaspirillum sp. WKF16]